MLDTLNNFKMMPKINKFATKPKSIGRHMGESSRVLSRHRFEVSSSDLPLLLNLKPIVMLDTKGQSADSTKTMSVTAESIVTEITSKANPIYFQEGLRELIDHFFLNYENPSDEYRDKLYFTYKTLHNALGLMTGI